MIFLSCIIFIHEEIAHSLKLAIILGYHDIKVIFDFRNIDFSLINVSRICHKGAIQ